MRRSLTRSERIKNKADFTRVFNHPDVTSGCRGAKLVAKQNGLEYGRFAVTTVRKYGNAVERNYARRILREIYRNAKRDLPIGFDIIIVLFPGKFDFHDREKQFANLIRRADFGPSPF